MTVAAVCRLRDAYAIISSRVVAANRWEAESRYV